MSKDSLKKLVAIAAVAALFGSSFGAGINDACSQIIKRNDVKTDKANVQKDAKQIKEIPAVKEAKKDIVKQKMEDTTKKAVKEIKSAK